MGKTKRSKEPVPSPFSAPPVSVAEAVPEGKVVDYLTGRFFNDTPEEYVRQNIEKAIVRQYRYSPTDCAPEFRISVGSAKPRVDVAVFMPQMPHIQANASVLVETKRAGTKRDDKKDGIGQLHSYMASCVNANYGLWTNGDDRVCFVKRAKRSGFAFDEVVDIPASGQSESDIAQPKHKDLMPATADNLLFAFRRCHNFIAGQEGMQKPDAFWELLKLIFTKIEDERSKVLEFYVAPTELGGDVAAGAAKSRLNQLLAEKVITKYPTIFSDGDRSIKLKPSVVAYVVSQLQRYSLLKSPVDVKGVAYEEVVGSNLRGDRGEFFTPRNACRMAVEMLDPRDDEHIFDPACGTGGFLITGMNHAVEMLEQDERSKWDDPESPTTAESAELYRRKTEYFRKRVSGFDLNPSLVRAAKMNMVMNNDGEGGLFQADSLANPRSWDKGAAKRVTPGSIDVLFTNPPFGANIKVDGERLEQYELAANWDQDDAGNWVIRLDKQNRPVLQKSQPPEILFIERCVQLLKPGTGRMAMVIPNGILNNPANGYVRSWMLANTQIIAVVDMARELFQPKNDTQTSMVLLRRLSDEEKRKAQGRPLDYAVFMAVAERIGHDKRRNPIYRRRDDGQELLRTRIEEDKVVDQKTGEEKVVRVEVKERVIDDELPEVAAAFRQWAAEAQKK